MNEKVIQSKLNPWQIVLIEKYVLLLLDVLCFILCFSVSHLLRFQALPYETLISLQFLSAMSSVLIVYYIFDLYNLESEVTGLRVSGRSILAVLSALTLIIIVAYFAGQDYYLGNVFGRGVLFFTLGSFCVFSILVRTELTLWFRKRGLLVNWILLGKESDFETFFLDAEKFRRKDYITFLSMGERSSVHQSAGTEQDLEMFISRGCSGVIIGESVHENPQFIKKILDIRLAGVKVYNLAEFYQTVWNKVPIQDVKDQWFLTSSGFLLLHNPIGVRVKRVIDILLACLLFLLTSPVMLVTAFLIKMEDFGSIFYTQERVGFRGKPFKIIKFRSMRADSEKDGAQFAKKGDLRVTKVGRFIRLTRIDELPQVINVLRGEMSFIGPRPERPVFVKDFEKQIPYYNLRHLVKPGITGWAQVLYPYGADLNDAKEKLQYDLYYIKNFSLFLDLAIIIKTIRVILFGKGR